jgi:undecaprenyl-diphosphatase
MVTYFQAIIIGLLQGVSELFPISSLGHSVIFPKLVGWNIDQSNPYFLMFLVGTHLATAIVLFFFFRKDWWNIFKGMGRSLAQREITEKNYYGKLGWLLVVGTVPAGIIGLLFQEKLQTAFALPKMAALFLSVNGILLYFGELLRRRAIINGNKNPDAHLGKLSWWQAIKVGTMQIIALIPGFSRSGSTIVGGLIIGLSHEDAARFSFLLATPIIGAAALLKIPELFISVNRQGIAIALAGALSAAISAYLSIKFLMKHFHTKTLTPFALYCVSAGIVFFFILSLRS